MLLRFHGLWNQFEENSKFSEVLKDIFNYAFRGCLCFFVGPLFYIWKLPLLNKKKLANILIFNGALTLY